jgi:hypothetical protein
MDRLHWRTLQRQGLRLLAFCLGAIVLALPHAALSQSSQTRPSTAVFAGADTGPSYQGVYAGAVVALNGDLTREGVLFRGLGIYGWYDYRAPVGDVDGRIALFDAMIGYQWLTQKMRIAAYIGIEHQDHHLSPFDPTNSVIGGETGLKLAGDITMGQGQSWYLNLSGSYSTAFDTYWSRLRIGQKVGQFTLGPEGLLLGNERYDAQRLGIFLGARLDGTPIEITVSGGYNFEGGDAGFGNRDGAYGSLNIGVAF